MTAVKVTTTLDENLRKLAKQHKIQLSFALEFGLRRLLNRPLSPNSNEKIINQDPDQRLKRVVSTMQQQILELDDEITKLRKETDK